MTTTAHTHTDPIHVDDASFTRALQRSAALERDLRTAPQHHVVLSGDGPPAICTWVTCSARWPIASGCNASACR